MLNPSYWFIEYFILLLRLCSWDCDSGESQVDYNLIENRNRLIVVWIDRKRIMAGGNEFWVSWDYEIWSLCWFITFVEFIYCLFYSIINAGAEVFYKKVEIFMDWTPSLDE